MDHVQLDSLDCTEENDEGTYRVNFPHPHPVEDENSFVTDSGRQLRNYKPLVLNSQFPQREESQNYQNGSQESHSTGGKFEMTDSMQAQLHLSLDRLSETSIDTGENSTVKTKSKIYPALQQSSFAPPVSQSPVLTAGQSHGSNSIEPQQAPFEQENSLGSGMARTMLSTVRESTSTVQDSLVSGRTHSDNIRAVAVDDSIDESGDLPDTRRSDKSGRGHQVASREQDPYAYLRYNPDWRDAKSLKTKPNVSANTEQVEAAFHDGSRLPSNPPPLQHGDVADDTEPPQPSGGAITIHNSMLSPSRPTQGNDANSADKGPTSILRNSIRDSPVRLSADANKLLSMNAAYEREFSRMLQLERQWDKSDSLEHETYQATPAPESGNNLSGYHGNVHNAPAKPAIQASPRHQFPYGNSMEQVTHQPFPTHGSGNSYSNIHNHEAQALSQAANHESPRHLYSYDPSPRPEADRYGAREVQSLHNTPGKTSTVRRLDGKPPVPTPPRVPKTTRDRDYIEMNKSRLGRKSNSASYLEMYSKRVKKRDEQDQHGEDAKQVRPKSDTEKLKQRGEPFVRNIGERRYNDVHKENLEQMDVEDKWKFQAERLKEAKEAKTNSRIPRRQTLREVCNTSGRSMPHVKPEDMIGRHRITGKVTSPRKPAAVDDDDSSDFTDHPAFLPFTRQRADLDHEMYPIAFPSHPSQQAPYRILPQESDAHDSSGLSSSFRSSGSDERSDGWSGARSDRGFAEPLRAPQYLYVDSRELAASGYHRGLAHPAYEAGATQPSPLMRAYQHRYVQDRNDGYGQVPLPPNPPANPMSPRGHGPARSYESERASRRQEPSSDSLLSDVSRSSSKKRVNFDPSTYDQPGSRIPMPSGPYAAYRYPIPLPPAQNSGSGLRSAHRLDSNSLENLHSYGNSAQSWFPAVPGPPALNRLQAVPALPPILVSRKGETSAKNYSSAPESSRNSDDEGAKYSRLHEKKKKKPSYKRYTLEDYKSLKKDHLNVGGLGPDLVAAKEKMGKVERSRKYSEFVRQQHMSNATTRKNAFNNEEAANVEAVDGGGAQRQRFVVGAESEEKKREMKEKRRRAIEYARQVPKPKAPPTEPSPRVTAVQSVQSVNRELQFDEEDENDGSPDWDLLQALRERHEREKAMVAQLSSSVHM